MHRRRGQPGAPEHFRPEGRWAPSEFGQLGRSHDVAVVRRADRLRPGQRQAARLPRAARDLLPARRPAGAPPRHAARTRRPAVVPEPHEGPRPGRLLHRQRRHRRDRTPVGRARAPLPALARPVDPGRRAVLLDRRRRRPRRGRCLGGGRRPDGRTARRGDVARRLQPPVARPDRARRADPQMARAVRGRRLAGAHVPVGAAHPRGLRPPRRAPAATAPRGDAQRGVPAAAALRLGRGAPAVAAGSRSRADRGARRGRPGRDRRAAARPRRARHRSAARRLRPDRPGPPHSNLCVHGQGARAADRGSPGQPLGAAHRGADGAVGGRQRHVAGAPVAAVRVRLPRGRTRRRDGAPAASRPGRAAVRATGAHRAGPAAPPAHLDAGRARPRALRGAPRGARARGAARHAEPRRRVVDQPRRLDQQERCVVGGRAHRLVCRRSTDAAALAGVGVGPPPRARHRGGQPRQPGRGTRRDVVALGSPARADRDAVRPVRLPGPGAVVVLDLRRRSVDPRRHPLGGDARVGGRCAPVDLVSRHRAAAAWLHRLGARVRPGPGVDAAAPGGPHRGARWGVGVLPALDPRDRPVAGRGAAGRGAARAAPATRARRRIPARGAARRPRRRRARRDGRRDAECAGGRGAPRRPRRAGGRRVRQQRRPAVPGAAGARRGLRGLRAQPARNARPIRCCRCCCLRTRPRRWSPCSTGIRTRWRSSPGCAATASRRWASRASGSRAAWPTRTRLHGIDADAIVAAALDLLGR